MAVIECVIHIYGLDIATLERYLTRIKPVHVTQEQIVTTPQHNP